MQKMKSFLKILMHETTSPMSELWNTEFLAQPIFKPLQVSYGQKLSSLTNWPSLVDYQQLGPAPVQFIAQHFKPQKLQEQYESRIFFKKEVLTRECNWHDLFNTLSWHQFPKSKLMLNQLQVQAIQARQPPHLNQRGRLEHWITQWDECGIVVVSRNHRWLEYLVAHDWHAAFVQHRDICQQDTTFMIYGHGLYEKALHPFLGLTGKGLLLYWPDWQPTQPATHASMIDDWLVHWLPYQAQHLSSKGLQPVPLLGVPSWDPRNEDPSFYQNSDYFRPGRVQKTTIVNVPTHFAQDGH